MKVKMLATMAGPEGCYPAGSIATFDKEFAQILIDANYAEAAE
ncbi:hypothetical protein [Zoogloea sp.]